MQMLKKLGVLFVVISSICSFFPIAALAVGDTNEVWISARTNALGTGSIWGTGAITNPFYGDFNAIMNGLPTNTTIHLLPGTHYTTGYIYAGGDFRLKAYQKIIGAGIDVTIVKRDASKHPDVAGNIGEFLALDTDGVEVSDLTVDASGNGSNVYCNNAVNLWGNDCSIRRVKAINCSGNKTTPQESFPLGVGGAGYKGCIISECEVSSVQGDYCSAILVQGQAIVEKNRVYFPPCTPSYKPWLFAYTTASARDAVFFGNFSEGGNVGFRTDTGTETNLTITANSFKNVMNGVIISKSPGVGWLVDGVAIKDNLIEINTNIAYAEACYGIQIYNQETTWQPWRNVSIDGNTMRYVNGSSVANQYATVGVGMYSTIITNLSNIKVIGNTIERVFEYPGVVPGHGGNWWADNTDLNGVLIQVKKIGSGSAASVSLIATDGSIFVTSTTTTNIVLPAAFGFTAKEVRIVNQKSSGNLTVRPLSGDTLLPSNPITISSNQTAAFISDGKSTWIRE